MIHRTQQWLLALLLCLHASSVFAQVNVTVRIHGVNSELEQNIRLYLSIEQQKNNPLLSEGRLHRLQKKAPEEISKALQPLRAADRRRAEWRRFLAHRVDREEAGILIAPTASSPCGNG